MDTIIIPQQQYIDYAMPANEFALNQYFYECIHTGSALWAHCAVPEANVSAGKYWFSYRVEQEQRPAIALPAGWLYVLFHSHRNNRDVLLAAHTELLQGGKVAFSCDLEREKLEDVFAQERMDGQAVDAFIDQLGLRYLRLVDWINQQMLKSRRKVEKLQTQRLATSTTGAGGGAHQPRKRVVHIGAVQYVHTLLPPNTEDAQKRAFERHVAAWRVRGHIRHLKSGKEVFVRPYIKGDKSKIADKEYVV